VVRSTERSKAKLAAADYRRLLDVGLGRLAQTETAPEAILKLVPSGPVGLKTNCLTGRLSSTPAALVEALGDIFEEAGWNANDIVVWERTNRELQEAGFELNASSFGRRCLGTDTRGVGYGDSFESSGEVHSLISRVLLQVVEANINLPVLKDHSLAGLSGGLKNMFGAINNPNKYHGNNCDPFVAQAGLLPTLRKRHALTVMDAARVQYHLGPAYSANYLSWYGGVIMAVDPVAADSIGLALVEHLRAKNRLPSLADSGRPAKYLRTAEQLGLGTADLGKIDLQVLMVASDGRTTAGELLS
jgi:uncharacterized protein (DUF362 family)